MKLKKLFKETDDRGDEYLSANLDLTLQEVHCLGRLIESNFRDNPKTEEQYKIQLDRLALILAKIDDVWKNLDLTEPLDMLELNKQAAYLLNGHIEKACFLDEDVKKTTPTLDEYPYPY